MDEVFEVSMKPNGAREIKVDGEVVTEREANARWQRQQEQGPDKDHSTGKGRDRPWT